MASSLLSSSSSNSALAISAENEASEPLLRFHGGGLALSSMSGICEPAPFTLVVALEEAALRAKRAREDRVVRRGGEGESAARLRSLAVSFEIREVRIVESIHLTAMVWVWLTGQMAQGGEKLKEVVKV